MKKVVRKSASHKILPPATVKELNKRNNIHYEVQTLLRETEKFSDYS